MFIDDGVYREITVHSNKQTPVSVKTDNGNITVNYDNIIAEDGKRYAIDFTVNISESNGTYSFSFEIENKSNIRVNEVMCPYIDIAKMSCDLEDEEYFYPNALGERVRNPRARHSLQRRKNIMNSSTAADMRAHTTLNCRTMCLHQTLFCRTAEK